jgi:hypothetical protein
MSETDNIRRWLAEGFDPAERIAALQAEVARLQKWLGLVRELLGDTLSGSSTWTNDQVMAAFDAAVQAVRGEFAEENDDTRHLPRPGPKHDTIRTGG